MLKVNIDANQLIIENGLLKAWDKDENNLELYRVIKLDSIKDFVIFEQNSKKLKYNIYLNKTYGGGMSPGSVLYILSASTAREKEFLINLLEAILQDPSQEFSNDKFGAGSLEDKSDSSVVPLFQD